MVKIGTSVLVLWRADVVSCVGGGWVTWRGTSTPSYSLSVSPTVSTLSNPSLAIDERGAGAAASLLKDPVSMDQKRMISLDSNKMAA
jgi:hypothetical protein